jgi:hypothetical protein
MTNHHMVAKLSWVSTAVLLTLTPGLMAPNHSSARTKAEVRVLGLDHVIAFAYTPTKDFSLQQLHSATLIGPVGPADWKDWRDRGVVAAVGVAWSDLMRLPIAKAAESMVSPAYGGNPKPVVMIDEFGFDYGGQMDEKSARILRLAKQQKPEMSFAVWEMRGPIPKVLAESYRDAADLVMMEGYVGNKSQYWWIASQVWSARSYGILAKTIIVLGVGKGGNPGEDWAETKEELEQQIRFVRLIAPESPGVGFFSGTPELLADADAMCARFSEIPTDGSGLPPDTLALAKTFSSRHEKPTLLVSPDFVEPNLDANGEGSLVQPKTMRAYVINLGDHDARDVKLRLRNPSDKGGDVFAEGIISHIPKRSEAVGILPVTGQWKVWVGQWDLEVNAPGCEVITHRLKP